MINIELNAFVTCALRLAKKGEHEAAGMLLQAVEVMREVIPAAAPPGEPESEPAPEPELPAGIPLEPDDTADIPLPVDAPSSPEAPIAEA